MRKNILYMVLFVAFAQFLCANSHAQLDKTPPPRINNTADNSVENTVGQADLTEDTGKMPGNIDSDDINNGEKNSDEIDDEKYVACKSTPFIEAEFKMEKPASKNNNLTRKPGSPNRAGGNLVEIIGYVKDVDCLPIQGAVVQIWQTDSKGNYEWEYDTQSYWESALEGKDVNFQFSGEAQTNNLGKFSFKTIFPGAKGDSAPLINFNIKGAGHKIHTTRMYFSGHPRNEKDPVLIKMKDYEKEKLIAKGKSINPAKPYEGRIYLFPITIPGINPYKQF